MLAAASTFAGPVLVTVMSLADVTSDDAVEASSSGFGSSVSLVTLAVFSIVPLAFGALAGAIFKRVWKIVDREHDAPDALQAEYSWPKMLLAATLQGAIFAAVKAAIDRGGAKGFERATGEWPGS